MKNLVLLGLLSVSVLSARATAINLSGANGEWTLQQILAGTTIDVVNDQLASDSYFSASAFSGQMVVEIAGYAPNNAFGIYQQGNTGNKVELFSGAASAGAVSALLSVPSGWSSFGFYLTNSNVGFTWYSDASLNADGGLDHFVMYQGTPGETLTLNGMTFGANDYIIGIEDLSLGDYDYNDMVVKVSLNNSVPDSGSALALLGGALGLLAFARRRLK